MTDIETYEHSGVRVRIWYDDFPAPHNPREWEYNLGTIVAWHPDYILGDEQIRGSRGAVETVFETETGRTEFSSMAAIARYLTFARGAICLMPLYLFDHSGISISAGRPNPFDNPIIRRDEFGTGMGWDTSMVGFIYTTRARIEELCGPGKDGGLYCPPGWEGTPEQWIEKQLDVEVETYDSYLRGEVYGYTVAEGTESEESCGGYLGDPDESGCKEEANAAAELAAKELAEADRRRRIFLLDVTA